MKKLNFIVLTLFATIACLNFTSCSNDEDEPKQDNFYGIWSDVKDPDYFPLLITKDCIVMWDGAEGNANVFVPFLNASYETLAYTFAPNDEFFIYRKGKNPNQYILYSGDAVEINGKLEYGSDLSKGTLMFDTAYPIVMNIVSNSDGTMTVNYQWYHATDNPSDEKRYYVTREKILSDDQYCSIPSDFRLDDEEGEEIRIYNKYR